MLRSVVIIGIGIAGLVGGIAGFILLPDPHSVLVAAFGALIAIICVFLLKVSAEPAVGTNDEPPSAPF